MSKSNFRCKECQHEFHVTEYHISYRRDGVVFFDKRRMYLICPECESQNLDFIKEQGHGVPMGINIGKFSSASTAGKQEILAKRADEHYKKKGKELKEHIDKNFTGKTKDIY